jgi:hypothetical protein
MRKTLLKRRKRTHFLTSSIFILNLIGLIFLAKVIHPTSNTHYWYNEPDLVETLTNKVRIDDSLPHYQYRKIHDSIAQKIRWENIDNSYPGDGWSFLNISATKLTRNNNVRYYFNIPGYYKVDRSDFYTLGGKNYLNYTEWKTEATDSTVGYGEIVTKETSMRFIRPNLQEQEYIIGVPLTKSAHSTWRVIIIIFSITLAIVAFYSLILIPFKLLKLIARGEAFNDETIGSLYTIGGFLISIGLILSLTRLGGHLFLSTAIPSVFTYYVYDDFMLNWLFYVIGLIVLLFAKAFQKGYQLQEEQELTV